MTGPAAAKALGVRMNRRLFWAGMTLLALGTGLAAERYPWVLNGGFVLPWVLLHAARLHDFGRRGLWAPVAVVGVLAALIGLATYKPPTLVYGIAAILSLAALGLFTLWVGLMRGDAGPNRFGGPPKGWRLGR